jgi:crossover junction endodeoxyribonuclease RusA
MEPVRIELPWPYRKLHPNSRPHWRDKAKATKAAREFAHWTAKQAKLVIAPGTLVRVRPVFVPPTYHARDVDGLLASLKAYLDGIADATGINDRNFRLGEARIEPFKAPGSVVLELEVA